MQDSRAPGEQQEGNHRSGCVVLFMSGYAQPILDANGVPSPRYDIRLSRMAKGAFREDCQVAMSG